MNKDFLKKLKEITLQEKKIVREMSSFSGSLEKVNTEERKMIISQIISLKHSLKKTNEDIPKILGRISLVKPLLLTVQKKTSSPAPIKIKKKLLTFPGRTKIKQTKELTFSELEKETIKRMRKKEKKITKEKEKKPSKYVKISNKIFSNFSKTLLNKDMFRLLKRNLIKANLQFIPISYISLILFTTLLSSIVGIFVFLFFLFFNFGSAWPIITIVTEDIQTRFLKVFWVLFVIPIGAFLIAYFYPSLEKKSAENKINHELPFATIHMSAISSSMIEPSKIFSIIISTKEYPAIEKEFTKLINEINIYGYNLVSALRNSASNSPSAKLAELLNGLATTITSGGDLSVFFEKRAQSLLFEHRLEREKYTRSAETFMDIYISVVIAAPMILMLLLMMMKIGGLGISLSTSMISLIMVLGVFMVNILFLTFLHLKQPNE